MRFNKDALIWCMVQGIGALLILWLCLHLVGCRTIQQQTAVHNRDSVRIEVRLDSIYVYEHDSIYRDRWKNGDTVFVQVEKWKTRYRDKLREVHDTIAVVKTDSIPYAVEVIKQVPVRNGYTRFTSWFFWIIVVLVLARIAFWVCDKIPATKPYTSIIKGLFGRL